MQFAALVVSVLLLLVAVVSALKSASCHDCEGSSECPLRMATQDLAVSCGLGAVVIISTVFESWPVGVVLWVVGAIYCAYALLIALPPLAKTIALMGCFSGTLGFVFILGGWVKWFVALPDPGIRGLAIAAIILVGVPVLVLTAGLWLVYGLIQGHEHSYQWREGNRE